jgi:hypothetical protein
LLSLDSTTISPCLTMFPWAQLRPAEGGIKAHVLLDHDDYLPSDIKLANSFTLNPGSIITMDRGYTYLLCSAAGRWMRQLSSAGYQRRHGVKDDVETGEALGSRRRNLAEEMPAITASRKCWYRASG